MTKAELLRILEGVPDDAPIAILLADGNLDFATDAWIEPQTDDDGQPNEDAGAVVISGN